MKKPVHELDLAVSRSLRPEHGARFSSSSRGPGDCVARCGDGIKLAERTVALIKVKSRGNETAEQMLRRFKKACEKEGLTKDIKRVAYYEKPSEKRRRRMRTKPKVKIGR